jgi:hypothetical protein
VVRRGTAEPGTRTGFDETAWHEPRLTRRPTISLAASPEKSIPPPRVVTAFRLHQVSVLVVDRAQGPSLQDSRLQDFGVMTGVSVPYRTAIADEPRVVEPVQLPSRHLRDCFLEGQLPSSGEPPLEVCALRGEDPPRVLLAIR